MENTRLLTIAALAAMAGGMYRDDAVGTTGGTTAAAPKEPDVVVPEGMKLNVFHFRKEKTKDEAGNEIDVYKHPSAKIPLPVPTREQLAEIFNAPSTGEGNRASEQVYILGLVEDAYYDQARDQINEYRENNARTPVTAAIIDYSKLTINALANMPASERGSKISDEDMAAFILDYTSIMPNALQKDAAKIKAQANLLEKGLRTVRTDKKVLDVMKQVLQVWAGNTANLEEHQQVYDMLTSRITKWVSAEPKNVLESIL